MRRWRWDLVLAAVLVASGLIFHGLAQRYTLYRGGASTLTFDRLTGEVCSTGGRCLKRGSSTWSTPSEPESSVENSTEASQPTQYKGSGPPDPPSPERVRELIQERIELRESQE